MSCSVVSDRPIDPTLHHEAVPAQSGQSAPKPSAQEQKVESVVKEALAKVEPQGGIGPSTASPVVQESPEVLKERAFVQQRKKIMAARMQKWKATYDPKPSLGLSLQRGMTAIIHTECFDVLTLFMSNVAKATTRERIAHLLRKNKAIMEANLCYMNSDTEKKVREASEIITHELEKLGNPAEPAKNGSVNKLKGISPKDPLCEVKTRILKKLDEWKAGFTPVANCIIATFVPGGKDGVVSKTEKLLKEIYKGIARAETKENLRAWLESRRQLMAEYTHLLNATAESKIEEARAILESEMKALAAS